MLRLVVDADESFSAAGSVVLAIAFVAAAALGAVVTEGQADAAVLVDAGGVVGAMAVGVAGNGAGAAGVFSTFQADAAGWAVAVMVAGGADGVVGRVAAGGQEKRKDENESKEKCSGCVFHRRLNEEDY